MALIWLLLVSEGVLIWPLLVSEGGPNLAVTGE